MKVYTIVSASILLVFGVLGFAFREYFDIPWYISIVNLILGLWGLFVIFKK